MRIFSNESDQQDRPLGDLFSQLIQALRTLILQEIRLAKLEISGKVSQLQASVILIGVGGILAIFGFLVLVTSAVVALSIVIPLWLATLCVGAATVIIGAMFFLIGRSRFKQIKMVPEKTLKTLEEHKAWIRNLMQ